MKEHGVPSRLPRALGLILSTTGMAIALSGPVAASEHFHAPALRGAVWHGDGARVQRVDWHGGRWNHGWHDGRWGWWWIDAGAWTWYAYNPYYPGYWPPGYPPAYYYPPAVVTEPLYNNLPAAPEVWYYCDGAKAYYPYVSNCPGGWRTVPAAPPAQSAPAEPPH